MSVPASAEVERQASKDELQAVIAAKLERLEDQRRRERYDRML